MAYVELEELEEFVGVDGVFEPPEEVPLDEVVGVELGVALADPFPVPDDAVFASPAGVVASGLGLPSPPSPAGGFILSE